MSELCITAADVVAFSVLGALVSLALLGALTVCAFIFTGKGNDR